ncbi:MAG: hypothetical protein ACRDH5_11390, partial [bacterium]
SYLRFTPFTPRKTSVRPRLTVLVALGSFACGGGKPGTPAPQSLSETLAQFMSAVKANDLRRLGTLWGSERGPATAWMKSDELNQRLTVIQKYLNHQGYRVVEGPLTVPGKDEMRTYRVELQRASGCSVVLPMDLVRAKTGNWLVLDVHLDVAGNPASACRP